MTEQPGVEPFLTLDDVAEVLATSHAQAYALVRRKELRAIKIAGPDHSISMDAGTTDLVRGTARPLSDRCPTVGRLTRCSKHRG